jgi:penicillin-insensitive murein endopeptidase
MKNVAHPSDRKPLGASCRDILRAVVLCALPLASANASTCYGTVAHGRLEDGVQLPAEGTNYIAYSSLGIALGRTYVHQRVRDIVVDAYDATHLSAPSKRFMYGETGLADGGRFKPHRTHQSGSSVDFMVPVLDGKRKPALLPVNARNHFGYALEFDVTGSMGDLRIDFDAMAEHLYQLAEAAKKHRVPIKNVIFQKELVTLLFQTARGDYLRDNLPFMKAAPWIKHDEHYHVDFLLPCRPLGEYKTAVKANN